MIHREKEIVCQPKKYEAVTKCWALSIFAAARSRVINPK